MTGRIKNTIIKQVLTDSYGFIIDENGDERFFHMSVFEGDFRLLKSGTNVDFEPIVGGNLQKGKGLRAVCVRVIA